MVGPKHFGRELCVSDPSADQLRCSLQTIGDVRQQTLYPTVRGAVFAPSPDCAYTHGSSNKEKLKTPALNQTLSCEEGRNSSSALLRLKSCLSSILHNEPAFAHLEIKSGSRRCWSKSCDLHLDTRGPHSFSCAHPAIIGSVGLSCPNRAPVVACTGGRVAGAGSPHSRP